MEMKKTSEQWCKEKDIKLGEDIIDPDGWDRSNFKESWDELISESEFDRRLMMSTCCFKNMKWK
jgi:hypothetical protein